MEGEAPFRLTAHSTWEGGTLSGIGTELNLAGSGVLTISTGTIKSFSGQISNGGSIVWTEGQIRPGTSGSNTFSNTGTIDFQGDGNSFVVHHPGSVVNEAGGTIARTVGTGTASIGLPLNNQGTIDVDTTTLRLTNGGSSSGVFDIASGAVLEMSGGNFAFNAGATSTGAGQLRISGGTTTVSGNAAVSNLQMTGGTISGGGGTLSVDGDSTWEGGTLSGIGTELNLAGSGVLTISTGTIKSFSGQISNGGSIVWTEGQIRPGTSGSNTFSNTGTIDFQGDGNSFVVHHPGSVVNEAGGTIARTVGTGTASIGLPLNNQGTIDVDTTTLRLTNGGSSSGVFDIASGAVLEMSGGNFAFNAGATSTGAGQLRISGGTTTVSGNAAVSNLQMTGGTISGGGGTLSVDGDSTWEGGTLSGIGTELNLAGSGVLTISTGNDQNLSAVRYPTAGRLSGLRDRFDLVLLEATRLAIPVQLTSKAMGIVLWFTILGAL